MNFTKTKYLLISLPVIALIILFVTLVIFPINKYPLENFDAPATTAAKSTGNVGDGLSNYLVDTVNLEVPVTTKIAFPTGYNLDPSAPLPTFITADESGLNIDAGKNDTGNYKIYLNDPLSDLYNELFYLNLNLVYKAIDTNVIKSQIQNYLGDQADNYGYFVYDINRDINFGANEDVGFRAASMVKVPIAVTVMREVDEGRLSLDTVYPLRADLIFNYYVGAGENPSGTRLTVRDYLNYMLKESDNTSLSHLDALLGETYGSGLNDRIKQVTGVDFYVNPPEATPRAVATVLEGLYKNSLVSANSSEYIITLLKNALPDLKTGVGLGLPEGVDFANKIGFLDTNEDLSYMDSAIIYGPSTDYVLVVMDRNQDWDVAQNNLKNISTIIYNNLN